MTTDEYISSLSDSELQASAKQGNEDCIEAANTERNSDWHDACFAACAVFSREMSRRGIDIRNLH